MSSLTIQPSYQSFCRLTQNDDSSDFKFIIKFEEGQATHQVDFKTTLNKARVISRKVNTYYQTDPTLQSIELNIPFYLRSNHEKHTTIQEQIETIFNTILETTNKSKQFTEDDLFILTILMKSIEYEEKGTRDEHLELTKYMKTIQEAVSLLSTAFHIDAVKFLSEHLTEFLQSDIFQRIDENIILEIIDFYLQSNEGKSQTEKTQEYGEIFKQLKDSNEPLFLMHFLLQIDENYLNNDMIEYIIKHIDDEIATKETHIFAQIVKKYYQNKPKKIYEYRFNYTGSLQTLKIPYDGNYEIEAIGAAGSGGNTFGTKYTSEGGKGAKILANFSFKEGDVIDIVVGGKGTSKQATATDGASGGGGGGTFIFKRISNITDKRYQFNKGDIKYETLLAVAGGSGGEDSGHEGHNSIGHDGEASNFKSLNNFTEYSNITNNGQSKVSLSGPMGISQFIEYDAKGSFYERANGISQGGYGCGASRDDCFASGGGWCQGTNSDQATSWSLDSKAVGTNGFNNDNGSVTIRFKK